MKDPEIRDVLKRTILKKYISDPHSKIVEELRLSPLEAQVDIAVINGAMHAFEIKSASDTLNRLYKQIDSYSKVFDYISVVTEYKYLEKIVETTPDWIGIYFCTENNVELVRAAERNTSQDSIYLILQLWKEEIVSLLKEKGINFKSNDRKWILSKALSEASTICDISKSVRKKLKERSDWKVDLQEA